MVVFWVEQLSRFTLDHPEGTPVPLTVMKRFLGLCEPHNHVHVIEETYPGVDSVVFKDNQDPVFGNKPIYSDSYQKHLRNGQEIRLWHQEVPIPTPSLIHNQDKILA